MFDNPCWDQFPLSMQPLQDYRTEAELISTMVFEVHPFILLSPPHQSLNFGSIPDHKRP